MTTSVNILNLPVAVSLSGAEYFPLVQGGVTRRAAVGLLDSFTQSGGTQSANTGFFGPTSGSAAAPAFRHLVEADMPYGTSGYALIGNGASPSSATYQGFLQSGTGATTRTWQAKGRDFVSIKDYGAVGDGVTDDTDAIDAARAASNVLYAPTGNYVYNGDGLEPNGLYLYGDGSAIYDFGGTAGDGNTTFTLGSGKTLVAGTTTVGSFLARDIAVVGGYGFFFHNDPAGVNVQNAIIISNVTCYEYTGCAIEHNSDDWPYWHISDCTFYAANDSTTMGVALRGDASACHIVRCNFLNNRIDIKHDKASTGTIGQNLTIFGCDFIHFTAYAGHARTRVWKVPATNETSKPGYVSWCDFGSENISTHGQDYHILFADAGAGASNGQQFPSLVSSTGAIPDLIIDKCSFGGAGATAPAPVTTYTNQLIGMNISDPVIVGTAPSYFVEIVSASTTTPDDETFGNLIRIGGTSIGINAQASGIVTRACNAVGLFQVQDPNAVLNDPANALSYLGGSDACGYVNLIPGALVPSISLAGTAGVVGATDSLGGSNAGTITLAATFDSAYFTFGTAVTPGVPLWLECDIQSGGASPLTYVGMHLLNNGAAAGTHRYLALTSNWRRVRIPYTPKATGANQIAFTNYGGATGTFKLGRVRVYHADEPIAVTSGIAVGTSAIYGGTTTRILYDNAGVVGEYTISGSGTVVAMATGASISGATITTSDINSSIIGGSVRAAAAFTTAIANSVVVDGSTVPSNGMYLPSGNTLGWSVNTTAKMQLATGALTLASGVALGIDATPACGLDVNGVGRFSGSSFPATGAGVEIAYDGTTGSFQSYNRTGAAWKALGVNGLSIAFGTNGTTRAAIDSSGNVTMTTSLAIGGATIGSNALAVTGGVAGSAQIWSGAVSTALSTLTGGSDGFRTSAANVTTFAGENTTSSASNAGGFFGAYSNDGAAMASGDRLGGIRMGGSSSASAIRNAALIAAFADEAWTDAAAYGSRLEFQTVTNTTTTLSTKASLSNAGIWSTLSGHIGYNATATPAAASAVAMIAGGSALVGVYWGTGDPNAALTAPQGSLYTRTDGGANTRLYINNNGGTGWAAVTSA